MARKYTLELIEKSHNQIQLLKEHLRAIESINEKCRVEGLKYPQITCSISVFVPKPHTPFQWARQNTIEEITEKIKYLRELKDKIIVLNNSSLLGTVKYACEKNDLSVYLKNAEYIDLSTNEFFSQKFIENMEF
jgi:radical SAM superfamily enzyme YgiQ (UPF0313 family)